MGHNWSQPPDISAAGPLLPAAWSLERVPTTAIKADSTASPPNTRTTRITSLTAWSKCSKIRLASSTNTALPTGGPTGARLVIATVTKVSCLPVYVQQVREGARHVTDL